MVSIIPITVIILELSICRRGLHESDKEEAEEEIVLTKDVSVSKENLRKLQRESERLLRERRCMIRPAPVQRRSFGDLIQKITDRTANLEKSKLTPIGPGKPENIRSLTSDTPAQDATKPSDPCECAPQPPNAPIDVNNSQNPVGLNEDDEEDEELIVIGSNQSVPTVKDPPAKTQPRLAELPEPKVLALPPVQVNTAHHASPPAAPSSIKVRKGLLDAMRKTAQLRSEHLSKLAPLVPPSNLSKSAGGGDQGPAAKESFVPSEKFSGSRSGFVFQMGAQGLGYYPDPSMASVSSSKTNILPPPLEDVPEQAAGVARNEGVEEGESQPFGLEAGEELVLDYDDEEGNSMAICGVGAFDGAEQAPERPKPLRTYSRKQRAENVQHETQAMTEADRDSSNVRDADSDDSESSLRRPQHAKRSAGREERRIEADADDDEEVDRGDRDRGKARKSGKEGAARMDDGDRLADADDEGDEVSFNL